MASSGEPTKKQQALRHTAVHLRHEEKEKSHHNQRPDRHVTFRVYLETLSRCGGLEKALDKKLHIRPQLMQSAICDLRSINQLVDFSSQTNFLIKETTNFLLLFVSFYNKRSIVKTKNLSKCYPCSIIT